MIDETLGFAKFSTIMGKPSERLGESFRRVGLGLLLRVEAIEQLAKQNTKNFGTKLCITSEN